MIIEEELDKSILDEIGNFDTLKRIFHRVNLDKKINALFEQANLVSIGRLGYTDHGKIHAKIVARNGLRILRILEKNGIRPNVVKEKIGEREDAYIVVFLGAYFHDIGMALNRKMHELLGVIVASPFIRRILSNFLDEEKTEKMYAMIEECILCHMGEFSPTTLEAGVVEVADGTDITEGRARIPFKLGKEDIHSFSTIAIKRVNILEGEFKPLRIEVEMDCFAGVFQVEEILLRKIKNSGLEKFIELIAKVKEKEEKIVRYL